MSTTLYVEQENGNLKLVAEVEDIDNAALAVDALLDNAPRIKDREFVALVGDGEGGGSFCTVTVDSDEPVNPKRAMTIRGGSVVNGDTAEEESAPARRTSTRRKAPARKPAARKPAAKKTTTRKAPAKKATGRKPAAKRSTAKKSGGSPFKRNAKGDD